MQIFINNNNKYTIKYKICKDIRIDIQFYWEVLLKVEFYFFLKKIFYFLWLVTRLPENVTFRLRQQEVYRWFASGKPVVHSDALMVRETVAASVHARIAGYFTRRGSCGMKSSEFLSACPSELAALSGYFLNPRIMNILGFSE